jgi:hypothetical protein
MARLTMKQLDELHDEYTRDADYPEFRDIHDLLDTIDALESEKALERANERELILQEISSGKSIIPEIVHALDKLLAEAKLEEAEWWAKGAHEYPGHNCESCNRIAALRADARKAQP